jgi:beta-lactamase regulating signal transducer with metallopeptidase domain
MESLMFELALVVKATALLAAGLVLTRVANRAGASVRHLILAATFAAVLVLPLAWPVAPAIMIDVPVAARSLAVSPASSVASARSADVGAVETTDSAAGRGRWSMPDWPVALRIVWAAGAVLMLLSLVAGVWRSRRIRRTAVPSLGQRDLARRLADAAGIRRRVDISTHQDVQSPLTCGFRRPAIILPGDIDEWSQADVNRALVHELEHVRRGDWLVQIAARAVCAVYWFHPLAWMAWRALCLEAERACDDAVVRKSESTDYAQQLVHLARRCSDGSAPLSLAIARRSDLSARVTALLDARRRRARAGSGSIVVVWSAAAILVGALAPLHAVATRSQTGTGDGSRQAREERPGSSADRALYRAAERGDVARIEELVTAGANVNCRLDGDGSPLIAAAREGQIAAVGLLLDRGADPNMAVAGDGNALIMAAREGHGDVVAMLLARGATIDLVVPGDENALIQASGSGHLDVVKLLVTRGANVNARVWAASGSGRSNGEWRSPLSMARKGGHTAIVAYLQSAGARQ